MQILWENNFNILNILTFLLILIKEKIALMLKFFDWSKEMNRRAKQNHCMWGKKKKEHWICSQWTQMLILFKPCIHLLRLVFKFLGSFVIFTITEAMISNHMTIALNEVCAKCKKDQYTTEIFLNLYFYFPDSLLVYFLFHYLKWNG